MSSPIACLKPALSTGRRPTRTIVVTLVPCLAHTNWLHHCRALSSHSLPAGTPCSAGLMMSDRDACRPPRATHRDGCTCFVNPIETAVSPLWQFPFVACLSTCLLQIAGMPSMTNQLTPVSIANRFGHTARESEACPRSRQRDITLSDHDSSERQQT